MPFAAYDLSLDLMRSLREPLALVRASNADLARQLDRAADSIHLNLAEAGGRWGDDRTRMFRYAYGSLREVRRRSSSPSSRAGSPVTRSRTHSPSGSAAAL